MKIAIILGTRPEMIKLAPVIRECEARKIDYFILHTGQHYSKEMDEDIFRDLELAEPKYNLKVGSGLAGEQTGKMILEIEKILINEKPDWVIVQGDTNSVLAGAMAAVKLGIKIGHVEAGLRSYDRTMPEEVNRIVTDQISDYLFAPTAKARENAIKEGISERKIFITGNTIVDAVYQNIKIAEKRSKIIEVRKLERGKYILATIHRPSNVDNKDSLSGVIEGISRVQKHLDLEVILPLHPRTAKMIASFGIKLPEGIRIIPPVGFLDCLLLERNARIILTDSGGIQEEACILGVPCVTLRENTERPETIEVGASMLAGNNPEKIEKCALELIKNSRTWKNPFGDGDASKRIIESLLKSFN